MDNKFFLALVWIVGAAVVATLAYAVSDFLKWLAARSATFYRDFAMHSGAACAVPVRARGLIRIKSR